VFHGCLLSRWPGFRYLLTSLTTWRPERDVRSASFSRPLRQYPAGTGTRGVSVHEPCYPWQPITRSTPLCSCTATQWGGLVSAGSPFFDPLFYIKLRSLNACDDVSLWIQWGEQFVAILRGTGWLVIPLGAVSAWSSLRRVKWRGRSPLVSVAFLVLLWLVLFRSSGSYKPTGCCRRCRCSTC